MTAREGPWVRHERKPVVDLAAPALRTGPDVAAAHADRVENRDPSDIGVQQGLTRKARLENAPSVASGIWKIWRSSRMLPSVRPVMQL